MVEQVRGGAGARMGETEQGATGEQQATLYVCNLPWHVTDEDLGRIFRQFAEVVRAWVVRDRATGRSQGYGFVRLTDDGAAQAVRALLDGCSLDRRRLDIRPAHAPRGDGRPRSAQKDAARAG
jgi:RNA recognition motif-containing protein